MGFAAVLVYADALPMPFDREFTDASDTAQYADVPPPCLPDGAVPETSDKIPLTVLNTSNLNGLAAAVASELRENRGLGLANPGKPADSEDALNDVGNVQLRFGPAGIASAYHLAKNFVNPVLLLDDRAANDSSVTVMVGSSFEGFSPIDQVIETRDKPMESMSGCEDPLKLQPIPTILIQGATPVPSPSTG